MVERKDGALTPAAAREALHREGLVPPRILTLSMTGVCNLFCTHCWVDAGQERSLPVVPQPTIRRLLEEFAALGGEGVRLTGGEPLSHPGWRESLQLVRDLGLARLVLQTNGTLLDEAAVATLAALDFSGLQVQISLDGARARSHDRVRGEGTFAAAMQGVRRLVAAGLGGRIIFAFTEMRHNLEEFPLLLELAESLGVGAVVGGTLITGGRAAGEGDGAVAPATPEQYLALVARFEADADFRRRYQADRQPGGPGMVGGRRSRRPLLHFCRAALPDPDRGPVSLPAVPFRRVCRLRRLCQEPGRSLCRGRAPLVRAASDLPKPTRHPGRLPGLPGTGRLRRRLPGAGAGQFRRPAGPRRSLRPAPGHRPAAPSSTRKNPEQNSFLKKIEPPMSPFCGVSTWENSPLWIKSIPRQAPESPENGTTLFRNSPSPPAACPPGSPENPRKRRF